MKNILRALVMLLITGNTAFAEDAAPAFNIQKLTDDVYLHTSFKTVDGFGLVDANGLVVLDGNDAYIIDTPWSVEDTQILVDWLRKRDLNIKASVSTHFHEDRTAGIELLNTQSIPTYASEMTNKLLAKAGQAQAKNTFTKDSFWLLKDKIEVFYPGPGHSRDNRVVWLPEKKTLDGGCFVRAQETQSLGNTSDAVIAAWPASAQKLKVRYGNAEIVIPGHGKVGNAYLLKHTRELAAAASSATPKPVNNTSTGTAH